MCLIATINIIIELINHYPREKLARRIATIIMLLYTI